MFRSEIISILILLIFSAFFSAAETALVSISKQQLHKFKREKRRGFRSVLALRKHPSRMLTTILIGNNIVNIAAASLATQVMISVLRKYDILSPAYTTVITTIIIAFFLLIFGEITPKNIALAKHENMALFSGPIILSLSVVLRPLVKLMNLFSSLLLRLLGGNVLGPGSLITEQEILDTLEAGRDSGAIEHDEQRMMTGVIRFGDKLVGNVMTTLENVVAIDERSTLRDILNVIREKPRSRLPVYRQQRGKVCGVLYVKDLFFHVASEHLNGSNDIEHFVLKEHQYLIRKPFVVYAHQRTADVLKTMRAKKIHIAIVADRRQKTVGIITIEDLIEEIVGEIKDEYEK
jgi:CBS domain containing-hemolysin-like protein